MTSLRRGVPAARPTVPGLPQPGRPLVMGVVNVTPDSFSDGGQWFEPKDAIAHGLDLLAEGADLLDVGGESTRPGAERPSPAEERRRVLPVIRALAAEGAILSIDTMRAALAAEAVEAGARIVNDQSGGMADPGMLPTVAGLGVPYVLMHWRGHSRDMYARAVYTDVAGEVADELRQQVERALAAGITAERIILDPGVGFAKTGEHNWALLAHLDRVVALGHPVLVGVSRKGFLGSLLAEPDGRRRPTAHRDDASAAFTVLLAQAGVWAVRTHTARQHRDALAVVQRLAGEE